MSVYNWIGIGGYEIVMGFWNGLVSFWEVVSPNHANFAHSWNCTDVNSTGCHLTTGMKTADGEESWVALIGTGILQLIFLLLLINQSMFAFVSKGLLMASVQTMNKIGQSFALTMKSCNSIDEVFKYYFTK